MRAAAAHGALMTFQSRVLTALFPLFVLVSAHGAAASQPEAAAASQPDAAASQPDAAAEPGFNPLPTHHFQWAPTDDKRVQLGVNFGLLQLALGGFNVAGEVRYRRLWLEYSHGMDLKLNDLGGFSLSSEERRDHVHVVVTFTTGFGAGFTLVDELWLGVEFKTHRYEVNALGGPSASYQTYSVGPVLGYKAFIWKGLYGNAYARYWPNVASSLPGNKIALEGSNGTVTHGAHDFGVFANLSIGYAFDL